MSLKNFRTKVELLNSDAMQRALTRLSFEIVEKSEDLNNLCLVGIKTRGVPLAKILADNIYKHSNVRLNVGSLDIKFYRDDLEKLSNDPLLGDKPSLDFDINNKEVVIVDDVLYTGRTVRAAIDAIFDIGRPSKIRLAVLVDRGHRELPIKPDYIGKNVPTSNNELIRVNIEEVDGKTNVEIMERI